MKCITKFKSQSNILTKEKKSTEGSTFVIRHPHELFNAICRMRCHCVLYFYRYVFPPSMFSHASGINHKCPSQCEIIANANAN